MRVRYRGLTKDARHHNVVQGASPIPVEELLQAFGAVPAENLGAHGAENLGAVPTQGFSPEPTQDFGGDATQGFGEEYYTDKQYTDQNYTDKNYTEVKNKVSKSVSESVSEAPRTSSSSPDDDAAPHNYDWFSALNDDARTVVLNIYPSWVPDNVNIDVRNLNASAMVQTSLGLDWQKFFEWHRSHKPPSLIFRNIPQFLKGWEYAVNDYGSHETSTCLKCKYMEQAKYTAAKERLARMKQPCEWCQEEAAKRGVSEAKTVCDECWVRGRRAEGEVTKEAKASGSWK
jgi:hypothetical protein